MTAFPLEKRVEQVKSETTSLREEILVSRRHMYPGFALILLVIVVFGVNFADAQTTLRLSLEQVMLQLQELRP